MKIEIRNMIIRSANNQWTDVSTAVLAGLFVMIAQTAQAAPGVLEDKPLFTLSNVQSNIMIITDDSGSMNWEVLVAGENNGTLGGSTSASNTILDFTPDNAQERRLHCAGYNRLAYNPSVTYTPWKGKDDVGDDFVDRSLTTACDDPYDQNSCSVNISSYYYWVWTDGDNDGAFDTGECGNVSSNNCTGAADCITVSSLSATEKTNYANWYSYFRKRQFVAKRALTEVVDNSQERVGLRTLHNHGSVNTDIEDVDTISKVPSDPDFATAEANKAALLDNIAQIGASNGTPLRTTLASVGALYESGTPIQYSCQQNFSFLVTDGYWNGNNPNLGGVTNADGDNNTDYDGRSYADSYNMRTLADVAMHYYERDLSNLDDEVPPNSTYDDLNEAQHMVTYTLAFGLDGTLTSNPPNRDDPFSWPQPVQNQETTIDDLRHAAWNGRGQFLSAKNPESVIDALNTAFADIRGRSSSAAAVAFNSNTLGANSALYLAIFDSQAWTGNLLAYSLDGTTGNISSTPDWDAAQLLDARDWSTRTIYSYKREANNANSTGVAFQWANVSPGMQADLKTNVDTNGTATVGSDSDGQARLEFLRGNTSLEGTLFRNRESILGDIVHAAPIFIGAPELNWPSPSPLDISRFPHNYTDNGDGTFTPINTYRKFKDDQHSRQGIIYVGSNDGMLHGFNADTGQEVMAYVPDFVTSEEPLRGLHYLSNENYRHRYYVDLSPYAADIFDENDGANGKWKTILVGGGGVGGRGIFALDVTSPTFSETDTTANNGITGPDELVLWEFTNKDYANLGYTLSQPIIVPLAWNADPANATDSTDKLKWAVVFGNGYSSYDSDTTSFTDDFTRTPTGEAELIILFLDADLSDGWTLGTDYLVISTKQGSTDGDNDGDILTFDASATNGLSSPTVVDIVGTDKIADRVYAGDLLGNMWAFDVSTYLPNLITGHSYAPAYGSVIAPDPLFTAIDTTGTNRVNLGEQPITERPSVIKNTSQGTTGNEPNLIVSFGTGQYLAAGDVSSSLKQSFYGIWDHGTGNLDRGDLYSYTITQITDSGKDFRILDDSNTNLYTNNDGWYMDLPSTRERVVTRSVARGTTLFFNTTIPDSEACHAGGTGWLMSVDAVFGGAPLNPVFDADDDDSVDNNDTVTDNGNEVNPVGERFGEGIPTEPSFLGDKQYTPGSKTGTGDEIDVREVEHLGGDGVDRVSWQEINPSTGTGF